MTLEAIRNPLLVCPHAHFSREGGASSGIYAGLNCGLGSGDQRAAVTTNLARAAAWFGLGAGALITPRQSHSSRVLILDHAPAERPAADGLVTATPTIAVGVLTADCMPVLLEDAAAGVVAAVHAGWKGALAGVLENAVAAMVALGARAARIRASIGPCIGPEAYEVGPDMRARVVAADPRAAERFRPGPGDRLLFDLPGYGRQRLARAGVRQVRWTGHCTFSDPARFYSYRRIRHRGEPDYGRLLSAIRPGD